MAKKVQLQRTNNGSTYDVYPITDARAVDYTKEGVDGIATAKDALDRLMEKNFPFSIAVAVNETPIKNTPAGTYSDVKVKISLINPPTLPTGKKWQYKYQVVGTTESAYADIPADGIFTISNDKFSGNANVSVTIQRTDTEAEYEKVVPVTFTEKTRSVYYGYSYDIPTGTSESPYDPSSELITQDSNSVANNFRFGTSASPQYQTCAIPEAWIGTANDVTIKNEGGFVLYPQTFNPSIEYKTIPTKDNKNNQTINYRIYYTKDKVAILDAMNWVISKN